MLTLLSWLAVVILSGSYWFQICKTHVHKEVRDISLLYHVGHAVGFGVLIITAWYMPDSPGREVFLWKQILTFIPVIIICWQILYHSKDHWHDDSDINCLCGDELELDWLYCPYCGAARK